MGNWKTRMGLLQSVPKFESANPVLAGFLLSRPIIFWPCLWKHTRREHQQRLPAGLGTSLGCATRFVEPTRPTRKRTRFFSSMQDRLPIELKKRVRFLVGRVGS